MEVGISSQVTTLIASNVGLLLEQLAYLSFRTFIYLIQLLGHILITLSSILAIPVQFLLLPVKFVLLIMSLPARLSLFFIKATVIFLLVFFSPDFLYNTLNYLQYRVSSNYVNV